LSRGDAADYYPAVVAAAQAHRLIACHALICGRGPGSETMNVGIFLHLPEAEDALREVFRISGGMVRDMIGHAGDACKYADHDNPRGKVELRHVQRVLDDRKAFFRRLLAHADYEILKKVSAHPSLLGNEGLGSLLHLKAVIYYPNGEGWYGLHPAVAAILEAAKR